MIPTAVFRTPEIGAVGLPRRRRARYGRVDIYKTELPAAEAHADGPRRADDDEARRRSPAGGARLPHLRRRSAGEIVQIVGVA